jgi:hypothetical protein
MARSEARLKFGIWRGLRGASAPAKLLYCVLLTDDSVNYAGVGRYCPELWAQNAEMPLDRIEKALGELVAHGWVVVDGFSFLIRTMIRNDGVADQPNVLKAALREAQQVHSLTIRKVLAAELRKLPPKRPDTVKGGKAFAHPDPHAVADELDPPPPPKPPKGSGTNGTVQEGSEMVPDPWENHPENPSAEPFPRPLQSIPSVNGSSEGIGRTPGGRGGGRGRGVSPVNENSTSTEPPSASASAPGAQLAVLPGGQLVNAERPTDFGKVWFDEYVRTHDGKPSTPAVKRAAKDAKALVDAGNTPARVLAAVLAAARRGRYAVEQEFLAADAHAGVDRRPSATTRAVVEAQALKDMFPPEETA